MAQHRVRTVYYWDLLKEDFVELANYCFSVELMPESMRQALNIMLF